MMTRSGSAPRSGRPCSAYLGFWLMKGQAIDHFGDGLQVLGLPGVALGDMGEEVVSGEVFHFWTFFVPGLGRI